jgi:hypothetical protein
VSGFTFAQENDAPDNKGFQTRIGTIIQTEIIPSLTGARDIGGCIVTNTGRIVIAAGVSDVKQNHPFKIAMTDDGGKTIQEVFTMHPENSTVTYHANGIAYDPKQNLIICLFGRTEGYKVFDFEKYEEVPFSIDKTGKNDAILALSRDNGITWHIDKKVSLNKHEHTSGMVGSGIVAEGSFYFPHVMSGVNQNKTELRHSVYLAKFNPIKLKDNNFTGELDLRFKTFSSTNDIDIRYSDETVYIEKLDGTGYISFTRSQPGPPYRREYDLSHKPIQEFERIKTVGFDQRDFDQGSNGPLLIAFNVVRLADGNLMYSSRYYGTEHHRAGNIFMTSNDEGKTWYFKDDYIPWTLNPLTFSNIGSGGNPQMSYSPDGSLVHITSQGWQLGKEGTYRHPSPGGFALCKFKGIEINADSGIISIDVSTIAKIDDVFIGKISVTESAGVKLKDETTKRYSYSKDLSSVCFSYEKMDKDAYIQLEMVLANKFNNYRPVFNPRIEIH